MNQLDLEQNLQRVQEWIKAADQKVSIFLAFQGAVISLFFSDTLNWLKVNLNQLSWLLATLSISGVVLIGYSVYKSVSAIVPRLKNHSGKKSLTYFGDIANLELNDFKKKIKGMSDADYEDELIEQIHISAKIAARKHFQFRDSIIMFFLGMFLLALTFIMNKI